jgi:outer membrane protein OmpA-like peptidoglycan-associated protein
VAIGEIVIDGLVTGLIRDQDGVWQHVMTAPAQAQQGPEAPGADARRGDAGLAWRLGGLRMTGDSYLTVADTLNPDMKPIRYQVERVALGGLDSNKPDRDTSFEVLLRPDQFSEFQIAGTARPLSDALYLDAEGHLHGFGLTSVNGLIANDLGHRFLDGQFDNDFHIKIEANQLDMGNQLSMAALDVEEIPDKEGPPLGTAIALLEDRDGNIKLEVPVSGDLTDPDFRVLGALNPIIMKAVAGTAALAIQPFGSVLLVGTLLADQALKVTFEPALFDPGTTTLNQAAEDYLAQLGAKLKEKPKLGVRVCGIYAAVEREKNNKGEFTDDPEALLVLAQQRADAVKAFMQGQGVGAKQLRTCRPSIDPTEEGLPRVDIRF